MSKRKGCNAERELLHMFFNAGWVCIRAAGSGSIPLPNPDLLAGKSGKLLAIECKFVKGKAKYLKEQEIKDLVKFAKKIGAKPLIGLKFSNRGWYFISPKLLKKKKNSYAISYETAKEKGLNFKSLLKI